MTGEFLDAYAVLGVEPDASAPELKAAHRRLVRRHHPDLQPPEARPAATRRVQQINVAYGLVRDERARAEYDRLRRQTLRTGLAEADATVAATWERLVGQAGRWAGRWWRRNRGSLRQAGWRARRAGIDVLGRVRWILTCALWTFAGLTAAIFAQDAGGVDGPFTLLVGGIGGLLVGNRRGWQARLRMAGLDVPRPGVAWRALLLAAGLVALAGGVWVDARLA